MLPDIREKIVDTIDLEKEAARKLKENGQEKGKHVFIWMRNFLPMIIVKFELL